ncbi:MAG: YvcK family protein [Anaerolineae bacterium]|nr:YvcK family protein [Anaerolineae bacterium]
MNVKSNLKSLLDQPNLRWLIPGLSLKRWLLLMIAGMALIALGVGYVMVEFYREAAVPPIFYYLTLQFLPRWLRAVLVGGLGIGCMLMGFVQFNKSLLTGVREDDQPLVEKLWQQRITSQGPRIVAIGGGHGLAALLRGLKKKTTNITAIVTVADDGGSSGRLRRDFGMLPPGDFRMCISALADDESLVTQLFQYRFGKSNSGDNGLSGHSFGNLFILAMAELTGSFEKALLESSKVVASAGRIVPSTLQDVALCAEFKIPPGAEASTPTQARGEIAVAHRGVQQGGDLSSADDRRRRDRGCR